MNRKAMTVAIVCVLAGFGAGLLIGSIFLPKPVRSSEGEAAPDAYQSKPSSSLAISSTKLPPVPGRTFTNASHVPSDNAVPAGAHPTTVADLEAALHSTHSRWDLDKIYQVLDGLDTNQFSQALAASLKSTSSMTKYTAVYAIAARWGVIDPQGAIAFAQTLGNSSERMQVISGIVSGWADTDSSAAIGWAKQLPAGQIRNQAFNAIASAIGAQDPHAALALMADIPAGQSRQNMIYPLFGQWANQSPADAAAAALQLSGRDRDQALSTIANTWGAKDINAALAWANGLAAGNGRNQAIQGALRV